MVGQEALLNRLKMNTIQTFPHTILLLGESGCGKHTLSDELSHYYNIPLFDITNNISLDTIENIYLNTFPSFYLVDMTKVNEKQQNMLLKLIEEPNDLTYIILLSENKLNLLNTIVNRCIVYDFKNYTKDELKQFTKETDERLFLLCSTPGQLKGMSVTKMDTLFSLCEAMLTKMNMATFPNTLSIANKLNYKDDYDKFDVNIFFKALILKCLELYENHIEVKSLYDVINVAYKKSRDARLNKNYLVQSMLLDMWRIANGQNNL